MMVGVIVGEMKRKFESVYMGGMMDMVGGGEILQYWYCCGVVDVFDFGCEVVLYMLYDDQVRLGFYLFFCNLSFFLYNQFQFVIFIFVCFVSIICYLLEVLNFKFKQ